jgi:hypothetical protein
MAAASLAQSLQQHSGGGGEPGDSGAAGAAAAAGNVDAAAAAIAQQLAAASSAHQGSGGGAADPPDPVADPFGSLSSAASARHTLLHNSRALAATCSALYTTTATGLAPEIVTFSRGLDFEPNADARHSFLRPEALESLFVLRALGLEGWEESPLEQQQQQQQQRPPFSPAQETAWGIFEALERHTRVRSGGHATLKDVSVGAFEESLGQGSAGKANLRDREESFVFAETYKYLYMLAIPAEEEGLPPGESGGASTSSGSDWDNLVSLRGWVLNTEAHPLKVADVGPSQWRRQAEALGVTGASAMRMGPKLASDSADSSAKKGNS